MPTEILRPNGTGSSTLDGAVGAASQHAAINEAVADGDTSYVNEASTNGQGVFTIDNSALTTETINSLDVWDTSKVNASAGAGDSKATGLGTAGGNSDESSVNLTTTYTARENAAVVRPGGGSWVVSDIDGSNLIVARLNLRENGTSDARCTQLYVEVNYTVGGGGGTVRMLASTGVGT